MYWSVVEDTRGTYKYTITFFIDEVLYYDMLH